MINKWVYSYRPRAPSVTSYRPVFDALQFLYQLLDTVNNTRTAMKSLWLDALRSRNAPMLESLFRQQASKSVASESFRRALTDWDPYAGDYKLVVWRLSPKHAAWATDEMDSQLAFYGDVLKAGLEEDEREAKARQDRALREGAEVDPWDIRELEARRREVREVSFLREYNLLDRLLAATGSAATAPTTTTTTTTTTAAKPPTHPLTRLATNKTFQDSLIRLHKLLAHRCPRPFGRKPCVQQSNWWSRLWSTQCESMWAPLMQLLDLPERLIEPPVFFFSDQERQWLLTLINLYDQLLTRVPPDDVIARYAFTYFLGLLLLTQRQPKSYALRALDLWRSLWQDPEFQRLEACWIEVMYWDLLDALKGFKRPESADVIQKIEQARGEIEPILNRLRASGQVG